MPINDVQTTNRQHAVPQNIMDVEFKIIGDLTMRQFIYLLVFCGMAYGAFAGLNNIFKWPLVIIFVLTGIVFAFVPLQERGLDEWFINFFRSMYEPNQRVWRKTAEIPTALSFENLDVVRQELITLTPTTSRRKLEDFLEHQTFDTQIDPLDIPEYEYMEKLRNVFQSLPEPEPQPQQSTPSIGVGVALEEPLEDLNENEDNIKTQESESKDTEKEKGKSEDKSESKEQKQSTHDQKVTEIQEQKEEKEPPKKKLLTELRPSKKQDKPYRSRPITPDRHTGRKFTNLQPRKGEIILPIRGEKILQTADEEKIQSDINEKAEQLRKLLEQIKSDEQYGGAVEEAKQVVQQTRESQNHQTQDQNTQAPVQEPNMEQTPQPNMETQMPAEQKEEAPAPTPQPPIQTLPEPTPIKTDNNLGTPAKTANINPLSNKPNIVSGVVKDSEGTPLSGIVVIIRNDKEEPVRGIKTNQMGQFVISTALSNGKYSIITDKSNKTNLTFDIINFDATGAVIPPIEITGRA